MNSVLIEKLEIKIEKKRSSWSLIKHFTIKNQNQKIDELYELQ